MTETECELTFPSFLRLTPSTALTTPVKLGGTDTLKVTLTTQDGKTAKRPHQAFLLLQDSSKKLDVSYPFSVKESGKAKLELVGHNHVKVPAVPVLTHHVVQTHKDLPTQFLRSSSPLSASIVIASFGSSAGYNSEAFPLAIELDPNAGVPSVETPERYGKLPEIHHVFRPDAKSPNVAISAFFLLAIIATFPALLGAVSRFPRFWFMVHALTDCSGCIWVATSTTSRKLSRMHLSRTPSFSVPSWASKASSSCTIPFGISSRLYRSWALWGLSHSCPAAEH